VQLIAHRTNGMTVQSQPVTVDAAGASQRISVSSSVGDIDSFTPTADGGDLALDDLTMNSRPIRCRTCGRRPPTRSSRSWQGIRRSSTSI
jgi:hypothetical protein